MFDISYAESRPDIWLIPIVDQKQCSCGEDHLIEQWEIAPLFEVFSDSVPHAAVQAAVMFLWGYTQVCDSFLMKLDAAILNVTGSMGGVYSKAQATDIAGYFTQTWLGCPHQECREQR